MVPAGSSVLGEGCSCAPRAALGLELLVAIGRDELRRRQHDRTGHTQYILSIPVGDRLVNERQEETRDADRAEDDRRTVVRPLDIPRPILEILRQDGKPRQLAPQSSILATELDAVVMVLERDDTGDHSTA